jgi:hypothetical protein
MALVIKDRVRQTSTTAGYGTITLSGSVTGFQDFTVIGTGNTTYYTIADQSGSNWEVGLGTYTAPNQLARTTVYESSNGNALVNFGSNIKDVFATFPAEGFAVAPPIGGTTPNTITGTTVTAKTEIDLPAVANIGATVGVIRMVDGGDGYDYINIWTDALGYYYPVKFPGGADITGSLVISSQYTGQNAVFIGDGSQSGRIGLRGYTTGADVTVQAAASTIPYTLTLPTSAGSNNQVLKTDGSGNLSWTDKFVLGAGTATANTAPLKFTSGTNLTTAEAGAVEYNGTAVFSTGTAASGRGVVLAPTMVRLNADRTKAANDTTLEAIFDSANDALALAANVLYYFKGVLFFSKTATSSASTIQLAFSFSNTQQDIAYTSIANISSAVNAVRITSAAASNTTSGTVTGAYTASILIEGWFKSNATTGGTVTPQWTQSFAGTSVTPSVLSGSFIMIQPMSSNPSATLIAGNWS